MRERAALAQRAARVAEQEQQQRDGHAQQQRAAAAAEARAQVRGVFGGNSGPAASRVKSVREG